MSLIIGLVSKVIWLVKIVSKIRTFMKEYNPHAHCVGFYSVKLQELHLRDCSTICDRIKKWLHDPLTSSKNGIRVNLPRPPRSLPAYAWYLRSQHSGLYGHVESVELSSVTEHFLYVIVIICIINCLHLQNVLVVYLNMKYTA